VQTPEIHRLITVIETLLHPDKGCPWDLEQTHSSLLQYLLEESYEFMNAVEEGNFSHMKDELGDILLQVLLHSEIARKENQFNLEDVAKNLADKMIRRHPHVFKDGDNYISTQAIKDSWKKIKDEEKVNEKNPSRIDEGYLSYPSLYSSYKIGKKTKELNFDWDTAHQVMYKVEEEWQELKEELAPPKPNIDRVGEELGDFLFSAAQLARHLSLNPEELLRKANKKFLKRFQAMEKLLIKENLNIDDMTQEQLDRYWQLVKQQGLA
jgi:MazG family protein